jgi:hypothetical protein
MLHNARMLGLRIALIHATPLAVQPIADAFARHWPQAALMNLLDDSLSQDLAAVGRITPAITQRFVELATYVKSAGCEATLFTCSAFGVCIEAAAQHTGLPTWKPNQAMFEQVLEMAQLKAGQKIPLRVALMATFEPSLAPMREELLVLAAQRGVALDVHTLHVQDAMQDLAQGKAHMHHEKIASTLDNAVRHRPTFDCVVLAQFSMAAAQSKVAAVSNCPVLTSPDCAVLAVKKHFSKTASP